MGTETAIKILTSNSLPVTGRVDTRTYDALGLILSINIINAGSDMIIQCTIRVHFFMYRNMNYLKRTKHRWGDSV